LKTTDKLIMSPASILVDFGARTGYMHAWDAHNQGLVLAEYRPVGSARSGGCFLASLGAHWLSILLLLGLGTASDALRPNSSRRDLVFTELAPEVRPAAARPPAIPKPTLSAQSPARNALEQPRLAMLERTRPAALPEAPLPPPPAPLEPVRIDLPEATPLPMARPRPEIELGSFSNPVVEKAAPARVPAVTGAFAGAANMAAKAAPVAVAAAGFGEAAAFRSERQDAGATAGAGFGDATAGRVSRPGGGGAAIPGGFGDAAARTAPAESRQVRAGDFQSAMVIEAPKPAGNTAAEQGFDSAVAILDKPLPSYTEEARRLKIEGEVWLEVSFAASGQTRVLRVLKSLGHGLDESAARSAEAIRFRPATRRGAPVDATAVARIVFQLAY
jgi:TonB family protein